MQAVVLAGGGGAGALAVRAGERLGDYRPRSLGRFAIRRHPVPTAAAERCRRLLTRGRAAVVVGFDASVEPQHRGHGLRAGGELVPLREQRRRLHLARRERQIPPAFRRVQPQQVGSFGHRAEPLVDFADFASCVAKGVGDFTFHAFESLEVAVRLLQDC